jgi:hypothetical protein
MDQITIKTQKPKCRLYWCLIEFIDLRSLESVHFIKTDLLVSFYVLIILWYLLLFHDPSHMYFIITVYTACIVLAYVVCFGDLNVLVPSLLNELRNDLFASESEILTSRDYADLVTILDELTKVEI